MHATTGRAVEALRVPTTWLPSRRGFYQRQQKGCSTAAPAIRPAMASALGLFDGRFDTIKKGLKVGKVLAHAPPSAKPPRSPARSSPSGGQIVGVGMCIRAFCGLSTVPTPWGQLNSGNGVWDNWGSCASMHGLRVRKSRTKPVAERRCHRCRNVLHVLTDFYA